MLPQIFQKALPILDMLEAHQEEAYFVGGCVRDFLLDRTIGDIDIATSAKPEKVMELFPKVIPVGVEHGTVIVRHEHESYEVTTFRIDGEYTDHRRPDEVSFTSDLTLDLERRDFTINAMAMNKNGVMTDLFNGKRDIEEKAIRTVGNSDDRFEEDALRIIRGLRFSSQLGFHIDEKTYQSMQSLLPSIEHLAMERITNEWVKLFGGDYFVLAKEYLIELGIASYLPVFKDYPDVFERIPVHIQPLHNMGEIVAYFHLLDQRIEVHSFIKEWKCSNKDKNNAIALVASYNYYLEHGISKMFIYHLPDHLFESFTAISNSLNNDGLKAEKLYQKQQELPIKKRNELAVDGNALQHLFPERARGKWIRDMMEEVEKRVINDELPNRKKEIEEWLLWNHQRKKN